MNTFNIKHILVPVDFSESSMNAVDTAVAMAKRQGSKLTLLHVINQNMLSYGHFEALPLVPSMLEILRNEAKDMISHLKDKLICAELPIITVETVEGFIASEICRYAQTVDAELIVMGTHGSSGFREFFIGSNAYAVVKYAPCPVLTIPFSGKWTSFSKILFPVRDTPDALHKYDFLRKIIRKNHVVLHVLGIPGTKHISSKDWVGKKVLALKDKLRVDDVECISQILKPTDQVAEAVLSSTQSEQADLVAITATLDYSIRDFFIGPFTQQIVNHARIPVLSIRPASGLGNEQRLAEAMRVDYGLFQPKFAFSQQPFLHLNAET